MPTRILFAAILCLIPASAVAQTDTGPAPDVTAIHRLIDRYAKAVDTVDLKLLSQIWSHSPEVSFIYPLGEEHGFDSDLTSRLSTGSSTGTPKLWTQLT